MVAYVSAYLTTKILSFGKLPVSADLLSNIPIFSFHFCANLFRLLISSTGGRYVHTTKLSSVHIATLITANVASGLSRFYLGTLEIHGVPGGLNTSSHNCHIFAHYP